MNNRKGFALLETIVVILVLSTSMLVLYTSYKAVFDKEKEHLYYDDVARIYRSYFITNELLKEYNYSFNNVEFSDNSIISNIELDDLNLATSYYLKDLLIIKPNINVLKKCSNDNINKSCDKEECQICSASLSTLDTGLIDYLKRINYEGDNYLVVYNYLEGRDGYKCEDNTKCYNYYVYLDTGVKYE